MLRQAVASDIPAIQRVRRSVRENRLVSTVISDDAVRDAIEVTGRGWVVESQGEVVGFSIGNATNGNVWALFIHPDHEHRGHGRNLHDAMIGWMWSQGLDRLWLTTEAGTRAQAFYEAAGWQATGRTELGELRFELPRTDRAAPTPRMDPPTLDSIVAQLHEAGGFGDGIDSGPIDWPLAALSDPEVPASVRLAASLAIVCSLAEAVDNSTWNDVLDWDFAREVRKLLSEGALAPVCVPTVSAFFQGESHFWSQAEALYQYVVSPSANVT